MIEWQDLLVAVALLLVLEGLLPALYPERWRQLAAWGASQSPRMLRYFGLLVMAAGALIFLWLRR